MGEGSKTIEIRVNGKNHERKRDKDKTDWRYDMCCTQIENHTKNTHAEAFQQAHRAGRQFSTGRTGVYPIDFAVYDPVKGKSRCPCPKPGQNDERRKPPGREVPG